jgi:glycosyltransferase involved in cell wall biosynthesis
VANPNNSRSANAIEISVVIPARNEKDSIRTLLEDLLDQTFKPAEIVITDGGSTDGTREIIDEFITAGAPVKLIRETNSMPGRARNLAVRQARCDWIAFTDAGTALPPEWLEALARKIDDSSIDVVYGTYEPIIDGLFTECAAIAYVSPPSESEAGFVRPRSIASALMRRRVWAEVGGFPENLRSAEDLLFMNKVEQAGFRTVRAPAALVRWQLQSTLWKTFKRFVAYARHNLRAGLWRQWQAPIFRRYAFLGLLALPAIFLGVKWLIIPLLLWLALLFARAVKALWLNRQTYPAAMGHNALRLFLIMPIIAALDMAAFAGTISWLISDKHLVRGEIE